MRFRIGLIACALSSAIGVSLCAQELRGTVRDSTSRQPIPGAVLMLLDQSGAVLGRNITNERGEYRIVLSTEMQRMRVVRIGFRPKELPIPSAPGAHEIVELDVVMRALPTLLEPVRVLAGAHCPRRSDEATTFALLEQVRAGLLSIVVAREANPAALVRLTFERAMDASGDRIASQTVRIDSAASATTSFNAAHTATDFIQRGFMTDSAKQQVFFAPDAEVLLDEGFAAGYCFRIVDPDRGRPNQIGLGFSAADRRRNRIDIEGTLWVDTVARALRDIEHRYVGLDRRIEAMRPGGHIYFREMPNGVVMIDRWFLRLIGGTLDTVRTPAFTSGRRVEMPLTQVRARFTATENGGEVAHARWPDGTAWRGALGTLRVHATVSDGGPAAGTSVHLIDTEYRAVADSNGDFEISDLIPGPYSLAIRDPRLARLGIEIMTPVRFVAERDSIIQRPLAVSTTEEFVVDRCVATRRYTPGDTVLLIGRAIATNDAPVAGLTIALAVQSGQVRKELSEAYTTEADGLFQFCGRGLKPGMTIDIEASRNGSVVGLGTVVLTEGLTVVRLAIGARP
ncbi:MAG TPA: carboxypeptidase regulatory-like domain-containing protein [Gemmatimonadaceae bacterium]|jgi:hypothetical protein|nr:carboxypeptidase regulatory-like domain-containing protein [Gemmatimonadaceae bacterium]